MSGLITPLALSLLLFACGPKPATSLLRLDAEPAGEMCTQGGVAMRTGLDKNHNQVLDDLEITDSAYVCHGASPIVEAESDTSSAEADTPNAQGLIEEQRYEEALELCGQAVEQNPDDQQAIVACVIASCNLKQSAKAQKYMRRVKSAVRKAGLKQICMRLDVPAFGTELQ